MWKRDTSLTFGFGLLGLIVTGKLSFRFTACLSRKTGRRMRRSLLSASLGHRFGESDRGGRKFYVEPGHLRLARNLPRDSISSTRLAFVDIPLKAKGKKGITSRRTFDIFRIRLSWSLSRCRWSTCSDDRSIPLQSSLVRESLKFHAFVSW